MARFETLDLKPGDIIECVGDCAAKSICVKVPAPDGVVSVSNGCGSLIVDNTAGELTFSTTGFSYGDANDFVKI